MITENDVIQAICRHLEASGYSIEQALSTNERGIDVIARRKPAGDVVLVEAKGGTSSKAWSARHGKEFNAKQVLSHVARAFFTAAKLLPEPPDERTRVVVALPDTPSHRQHTDQARRAFTRLGISVWLVDAELDVREFI